MADSVVFVADGVFPEPSLPDSAGSLSKPRAGARLLGSASSEEGSCEGRLDAGHSPGEIEVAIGKRDQQMQVIVKQHDCLHQKRVQFSAMFDGLAEHHSRGVVFKEGCPMLGDQGEEECPTKLECTPIVGHIGFLLWGASTSKKSVGEYAYPTTDS